MQHNPADSPKSLFSVLHHITVVVKDMEKAEAFYASVGIGPFITPSGHTIHTKTVRGKPIADKIIIRETQLGPIVLQLVQHIEGESIYKEFVEIKGQGVQHLGFLVEDIDQAEKDALAQGLKELARGRRKDGAGYCYFDTESLAGVILEIRDMSC
jgi:catechol 2,3-dioxygenase-like lactoylglutathione lyase family enzyme